MFFLNDPEPGRRRAATRGGGCGRCQLSLLMEWLCKLNRKELYNLYQQLCSNYVQEFYELKFVSQYIIYIYLYTCNYTHISITHRTSLNPDS